VRSSADLPPARGWEAAYGHPPERDVHVLGEGYAKAAAGAAMASLRAPSAQVDVQVAAEVLRTVAQVAPGSMMLHKAAEVGNVDMCEKLVS